MPALRCSTQENFFPRTHVGWFRLVSRVCQPLAVSSSSLVRRSLSPLSCCATLLALFFATGAHAQNNQRVPHLKYMGVASCSSSNCHGATAPRDATNILQNEYTLWSKHDAHAKAWLSLTNSDSKRIAEHLGIANPEQEPLCLKCHATYTDNPALADQKFRVEDGVGCESCHGAAEKYLSSHAEDGATHKGNLEQGLMDLGDSGKRATLCLSCHFGNEEKSVTHRLIGAGHPRLTFELDTFTALQPVHWNVDDDYVSRKGDYVPAKAWLMGQITRAEGIVDLLQSPTRSRAGEGIVASPELTLLYCYTCHHSLTEEQWKERDYASAPGELRLNVSSLLIVEMALETLDPALASTLSTTREKLHGKESIDPIAKDMRAALGSARAKATAASFDQALVVKLMSTLASFGSASEGTAAHPPFEVAEQIAMGLSSLASTISVDGSFHKREIDLIYSALDSPAEFKPELFTSACQQLRGAL